MYESKEIPTMHNDTPLDGRNNRTGLEKYSAKLLDAVRATAA